MDDTDALALCAFEEAVGEIDDGVAAIVRVVLNRTARRYQSDGTLQGTIFAPNQFSWTSWEMIGGHYTKVAHSPAEVAARAASLLAHAQALRTSWARVSRIVAQVRAGTYHGPLYAALTDDAVMYLNRAIAAAVWATPDKQVCVIGHHTFYRA